MILPALTEALKPWLRPVKCNLSHAPESLAYEVTSAPHPAIAAENVPVVEWLGPVTTAVADLVKQPEKATGISDAENWLTRTLKDQPPVEAKDIEDAWHQEGGGLSLKTLRRAKKNLGVTSDRDGETGTWRWAWPQGGQHGPGTYVATLSTLDRDLDCDGREQALDDGEPVT